jgi:hypothetical protein
VDITTADQRLVSPDEVRKFDRRLADALVFAEMRAMRLGRLAMADEEGELGGWPEGFVFPSEAVAAFALLACVLEGEAQRMTAWAAEIRKRSADLWFLHGEAVNDAS